MHILSITVYANLLIIRDANIFLFRPKVMFWYIFSLTKAVILSRANTFLEIGIIYNLLYLMFLHFWKMPNSSSFACTACWLHNFWARKENYISKCSGESVLLENTINTIFKKSSLGTFRYSTSQMTVVVLIVLFSYHKVIFCCNLWVRHKLFIW